jgi:hypothetical protein
MKWRYGIVKKKFGDMDIFSIGEFYFEEDPLKVESWTEESELEFDEFSDENFSDENVKEKFLQMLERIKKDVEKYPIKDTSGS